ncbi:MAG: riboflavin synthase [Deltaproteobacteria bacterium]|nr:riboflavin synthase [Deltaproteobacteria bacterium]
MFTGIIQGLGRLIGMAPMSGEVKLTVESDFDWEGPVVLGESIAVSGACLTVTETQGRRFTAHVSAETISRTILRNLKTGDRINLERAMRLSDRLGGHLVTGHVDGLGLIKERTKQGQSLVFTFGLDAALAQYVIEKGSIAVDGISLTVNRVDTDSFSVNVIPHSAATTTLGFKMPGDYVNLETDLIGKYVARILGRSPGGAKLDMGFLAEHGFL